MKVFVNEKEIILFRGAKVKDAVLSFDRTVMRRIAMYEILDIYGNPTDIDGALQENSRLTVKLKNIQQ
ncbi:MAG: hypothetical protein LBQ01_08285 [Prevotellaceae bacterium]|jgi:hypothetical protein|nr:hypothetical protein [Prevotellaceae bacterium]